MTRYVDLKQNMRALRTRFSADSPIGHRASNVGEALDSLPFHEGALPAWAEFQQRNVDASIKRQLKDIARLAAG